jgi:hypothetical protein
LAARWFADIAASRLAGADQLNALQVPGRDTFKLVDPDGMLAEAECDLGVMERNDPIELSP